MHALFTIDHQPGRIDGLLDKAFNSLGPNDLDKSVLLQRVKHLPGYAAWDRGSYLLSARKPSAYTLELIVEPLGTVNMRTACETVWQAIRDALAPVQPRLRSLTIEDETSGHEVSRASTGLLSSARRPELLASGLTGLVTAVWLPIALVAFGATADLVLGAIPALLAGIVGAALLVVDFRRKKLNWS